MVTNVSLNIMMADIWLVCFKIVAKIHKSYASLIEIRNEMKYEKKNISVYMTPHFYLRNRIERKNFIVLCRIWTSEATKKKKE